jgi:hypothetical protein
MSFSFAGNPACVSVIKRGWKSSIKITGGDDPTNRLKHLFRFSKDSANSYEYKKKKCHQIQMGQGLPGYGAGNSSFGVQPPFWLWVCLKKGYPTPLVNPHFPHENSHETWRRILHFETHATHVATDHPS